MAVSAVARSQRYSRVAIAFHWVTAVLVIVNLWIGLIGGSMPIHKAVGITVLILTIARIGWRMAHRPPPPPPTIPAWQRTVARWNHRVFYALLVILPLSGWAMASGMPRRPLEWFGVFPIPYLPVSPALAGIGHEAHELLGIAMAALVALHVAAALRHQFMLRDGTLGRMMPGRNHDG